MPSNNHHDPLLLPQIIMRHKVHPKEAPQLSNLATLRCLQRSPVASLHIMLLYLEHLPQTDMHLHPQHNSITNLQVLIRKLRLHLRLATERLLR